MTSSQSRRGFTLTEIAIVLLVAGAIIGGIWIAAQKVWDNYRTYRATQQLVYAVQHIRDYYGTQLFSFTAAQDITETLDGENLLPQEMRRLPAQPGTTPIDHPFNANYTGGSFHVFAEADNGVAKPNAFRLSFMGLARAPCIQLLTQQPLTDAEIGIMRIGTQSSSTTIDNLGNSATVTLPLTAITATAWCPSVSNANEVDWDFKVRN